jgi:hypothetical protein
MERAFMILRGRAFYFVRTRESWRASPRACARRGLKPLSVLRDLLEREFPDTSGQFRLPL